MSTSTHIPRIFDPEAYPLPTPPFPDPDLGRRFHPPRKFWSSRTYPSNRKGPSLFDFPLTWRTDPHKPLAAILGMTKRERRNPSRYLYVRRVKAGWQVRIPVGPTPADSVNVGLFTDTEHGSRDMAEWAAGRAAKWFSRLRTPGKTCWQVVQELQQKGYAPAGVLPRWVYRRADGAYGAKRVAWKAETIDCPGPFATPEEAFAAVASRLGRKVVA